jgi:uroporphyrinogen-III synthase
VPDRFVAEGLLEAFPAPPLDPPGRVLVAQAEGARPVLVEGLRARGWEVGAVVAYRTVTVEAPSELVTAAGAADAVAFTSGSTVAGFVEAVGLDASPAVVAIGPVTADVARSFGLHVAAVADPHTLEGLVAAIVRALR